MKTTEQIQTELDTNIPQSVISKRDGGGGKKLDYLTEWYVADRLNQIFGSLNWSRQTVSMRAVDGGKYPTYVCKVRITVHYNGTTATREGTGYGSDKSGFNAHEMAVKEAESDAFKRAAARFGRSLGLALYDKSQEYVDDYAEPVQQVAPTNRYDGVTPSTSALRGTGVTPASDSAGLSKWAIKPNLLKERQNEDQKQKINNYGNKSNQGILLDKATDEAVKEAYFGKISIALMTAAAKGINVKQEYKDYFDTCNPGMFVENKVMLEKMKSEYPELKGI